MVPMSIRRVVPDITTQRLQESREFYVGLLGFAVAMDMDWVVNLVSPVNPTAQVILMTRDATAPVQPQMSIEVADVDAVHQQAVDRGVTSSTRSPMSHGACDGSSFGIRTAL